MQSPVNPSAGMTDLAVKQRPMAFADPSTAEFSRHSLRSLDKFRGIACGAVGEVKSNLLKRWPFDAE